VFDQPSYRYELDLRNLNVAEVRIEPLQKGLSRLLITDDPAGVVKAIKPNELITKYGYPLIVKSKAVDKTLQAFKDLATICSGSVKTH
jgi:hypothetical protein